MSEENDTSSATDQSVKDTGVTAGDRCPECGRVMLLCANDYYLCINADCKIEHAITARPLRRRGDA